MNKRLLKIMLPIAFTMIILVSLLAISSIAEGEGGVTFTALDMYKTSRAVGEMPKTFEAVIQLPKSYTARPGVIIGNFDGKSTAVSFEIAAGGIPRMYFATNNSVTADVKFSNVDVRSDKPVHLAIVNDSSNGVLHCYLDGELVQSVNKTFSPSVPTNPYVVGGDLRGDNAQFFKGTIYSVSLFSDVRSSDEIKSDANKVDTADSSLLLSYAFSSNDKSALEDKSSSDNDLTYTGPSTWEDAIPEEGLTFTADGQYLLPSELSEAPYTYEAWVFVPKGFSGRGGVIVGSYGSSNGCISFEINTNGNPRLYYTNKTGEDTSIVFTNTDVRTGEWAHVAITLNPDNRKITCYLNGEETESKSGFDYHKNVMVDSPALGGDLRSGNAQYFKGAIKSVALYSDVRTGDEIKSDMSSPDKSEGSSVIALYDLTDAKEGEPIKDLSGNGNDVRYETTWFKEKEPVTDYAYSFAVVGDTQIVTEQFPDKLADIYDFILEKKDDFKIEYVFGLGDITNSNTSKEWDVAKSNISKLDGVIPHSLVRGNHDGSALFNQTFSYDAYTKQFDGHYGSYENTYRLINVCGTDYLLFTLDYGASDAVLKWAEKIIEDHPEHRVIITTHAYLFRDGTTLDAGDVCPPATTGGYNNGDHIWDKLISKHENIFLVLSGHDPCDNIVVTKTVGEKGNTVTQMLIDPQGVDAAQGATGLVALLYFSNDGKSVTVEYYSTVRDEYFKTSNQFTISIEDFKAPENDDDKNEDDDDVTAPFTTDAPVTTDSPTPDTDAPTPSTNPPPTTENTPVTEDTTATEKPSVTTSSKKPSKKKGCFSSLSSLIIPIAASSLALAGAVKNRKKKK